VAGTAVRPDQRAQPAPGQNATGRGGCGGVAEPDGHEQDAIAQCRNVVGPGGGKPVRAGQGRQAGDDAPLHAVLHLGDGPGGTETDLLLFGADDAGAAAAVAGFGDVQAPVQAEPEALGVVEPGRHRRTRWWQRIRAERRQRHRRQRGQQSDRGEPAAAGIHILK
jgi:hypothetical protein